MIRLFFRPLTLALLFVVVAAGCELSSPVSAPPGGDLGATPGGVQDMSLARELVAQGRVPPPEALLVEAMFSEYDLPISGAPCERALCLRGALGIAPTLDNLASGWMQVGLSSNVDPAVLEGSSLTLVLVIDVSGSMGGGTGDNDYPTYLALAQGLIEKLVAELGPDDEVAVVTFGSSAQTVLRFTPGDQQDEILSVVRRLSPGGSTSLEAGLRTAYSLMEEAEGAGERRLMLFSDERPNVGATSPTAFEALIAEGARAGIGLTIFGIGNTLGAELFDVMARTRGGNAFSLQDGADITRIMAQDWPYLAVPIAYDLDITLAPAGGFAAAEGYGFPVGDDEAALRVATVFLSQRRGALLVRFTPPPSGELNNFAVAGLIAYDTPDGLPVSGTFEASYDGVALDSRGQYFAQPSVAKSVALAVLVSNLRQAAEDYRVGAAERAVDRVTRALARFEADVAALAEGGLEPEVRFTRDLLELMRRGAPVGF
ncbi:MAG: VWA domain-containing protein [Trueperaceae bacterium]|nr:VWA domain-containing protein [Trueperaceae bacterium]